MNTLLKTNALPQLFPYKESDFASYEEYCEAEHNYIVFLLENGYALSKPHEQLMQELAGKYGLMP